MSVKKSCGPLLGKVGQPLEFLSHLLEGILEECPRQEEAYGGSHRVVHCATDAANQASEAQYGE